MNCPICDGVRMKEVEREGVLIDICPSCKGVWLDRGELNKILSRVNEVREPFNRWYEEDYDDDRERYHGDRRYRKYDRYDDEDRYYDRKHYPRRKKKKSVMDMLGDMFD
ncbi:hypothetical protein EWH99_05205 [Sporolactobacillus sp. THM7-7]|nr:hypothetical protein EWH99_05205 [Sporolactobacillus sp. THM7-7]